MAEQSVLAAILLGLLEGLTEFIPVSSTGHILLAGHFLGFESTGKAFEVLIQLGAILAILSIYAGRMAAFLFRRGSFYLMLECGVTVLAYAIWAVACGWELLVSTLRRRKANLFVQPDMPDDPTGRMLIGVFIAFLPAAVIGALAHDFIKTVLFETPMLICIMLVIGGVILLSVDRWAPAPVHTDARDYPLGLCLKIGLFQCLAMIPGTSRSGATIVGALLMRADKRSAAEFSFFLAMPTMAGAFALDLVKNIDILTASDLKIIGIGFVAAFVSALVVVRSLLGYVSRHGYALFGWWRLAVGLAGIAALLVWG